MHSYKLILYWRTEQVQAYQNNSLYSPVVYSFPNEPTVLALGNLIFMTVCVLFLSWAQVI